MVRDQLVALVAEVARELELIVGGKVSIYTKIQSNWINFHPYHCGLGRRVNDSAHHDLILLNDFSSALDARSGNVGRFYH